MARPSRTIFPGKLTDWEDLENKVCQTFVEMGCTATRKKSVKTVRGDVDVDVVARDRTRRPHVLIFCECKFWNRKIPKTVVHAFRTVVQDSGASLGFIISDAGFQSGAYEAALKANIKLVTWKQFQAEMYDRWLDAMWTRVTLLANEIYELSDVGSERDSHPTLMSEALNAGRETASHEYDQLQRRYLQFSFASTHIGGGGAYREFPAPGIDPRAPAQKMIVFKSARMYFDIMLEMAHQAFADYVALVIKYTGGRCYSHQVLDDSIIEQIAEGKTTMKQLRQVFGHRGWIKRLPHGGEEWTLRGSITRFDLPGGDGKMQIGKAVTYERTLTIEFGPDEVAREIGLEESEYAGVPRP